MLSPSALFRLVLATLETSPDSDWNQLIYLAMLGLRNSNAKSSSGFKRLAQGVGADTGSRLLASGANGSSEEENEDSHQNPGYGALDNDANPRVEPSGLGDGRHQW